ncbi:hypothetical protein GQ43DRAFT_380726 [Delitschia confertaspora ATCC 74209]|uniref:Uncharacterized protein n=1 Tax=Delitschia confertaspora ATCC 74209 TaxID=1513339 RepID=A0A9P4MP29_9PLEO|nr:hypothetical protein GQ43DRAFT_380726 [Delitschia confertaspora ATCC 74209]
MAAPDDALTPSDNLPKPSSLSPSKRKRSETPAQSNGVSVSNVVDSTNTPNYSLQLALKDMLTVLRSYDTQPSILDSAFSTSAVRPSSGEPSAKRAKLASSDSRSTIAALIQEGSYKSFDSLLKDVETVSSEILSSVSFGQDPSSDVPETRAHASLDDTRLLTRILAFKKTLKTLVVREEKQKLRTFSNGLSSTARSTSNTDGVADSRTVLTLYGSVQGPKQLFSSLQQSTRVPPSNTDTSADLDTSIRVVLPLRESMLPNIISTTQIYPLPSDLADGEKKRRPTFAEIFGASTTASQLSPPKPAKQLTTRGSTISFVPQETLSKPNRKGPYSYTTQNLSTGQWLGYGGVDMPKDPTSPTAKQKSRQRALSTGEAQLPPSEATLIAVQQAKEDALFRSVYSSFAPSRDDATAIVPEETKNQIWWQRVGEQRFYDKFPIDPALTGSEEVSSDVDANRILDGTESLKEAVENYTPPEKDAMVRSSAQDDLNKSTDEVLHEISELLETLASHQRIRNSSLATNPRTPVIQNASLASLAGSPSTPSAEEIDVYEMLRSQLCLMISSLPPYAVAKLNGDQLAELNLDRTIVFRTKNYRGVMEEDQATRVAKAAAMSAPVGSSMLPAGSEVAPTHSHYPPTPSQYGRTASSAHPPAPRPVQVPQSYYPRQQQAVHRSPSVQYNRSSTGPTQSYQAPVNYANGATRPNFPVTQGYGQQTPRPSYAPATPGGQYYGQRPAPQSNYAAATPQYYQSTPQTQVQGRYPQQAQNGYQQRPQNGAAMYNYNSSQSPHVRTASPLKASQPVPQPSYHPPRPVYSTPVTNGQVRNGGYFPQSAPQPTSQFGTPQALTPTTSGPSAFHNLMGTEQHQLMLDRQRAQMAVQPQARLAAQGGFNRQGSGTPQPTNAPYGGQPAGNGGPVIT